ncbi:hypothetical protein DENSPDRAFT_87228 [Dentipellis sp. KUC8613]|nr:hypothetical protein DENSPDRAFT_87228 [Dentipellis sp. KUC8613]
MQTARWGADGLAGQGDGPLGPEDGGVGWKMAAERTEGGGARAVGRGRLEDANSARTARRGLRVRAAGRAACGSRATRAREGSGGAYEGGDGGCGARERVCARRKGGGGCERVAVGRVGREEEKEKKEERDGRKKKHTYSWSVSLVAHTARKERDDVQRQQGVRRASTGRCKPGIPGSRGQYLYHEIEKVQ